MPINEVRRCLMYHQYYGEPELARLTFAGLPEEVRQRSIFLPLRKPVRRY